MQDGGGAGGEQARIVYSAALPTVFRTAPPSGPSHRKHDMASTFWNFCSAAVCPCLDNPVIFPDFDTAVCGFVPETAGSYPHSDKPVYFEATFASAGQFWGSEISDFCVTRVLLLMLIPMF